MGWFAGAAGRRSVGAMRLKMCSIHVQDPAAAHSFYTETLGFDTLMAMPEHNLFIVKDPGAAGTVGLLLEPSDNPIAAAYMQRALRRRDTRPSSLACRTSRPSTSGCPPPASRSTANLSEDPFGISAVFDDGCGNFVQLHQD